MGLKGVKVNGQTYNFDYGYLENKPIPANLGNNSTSVVDTDAMVLAKDGNDIEWRKVLPSTGTGDEGKVLTVDECGFPAWMTPSGGGAGGAWQHVPYWDPEDIGKVLTITSDSGLEWTDVGSGSGSSPLPTYDTTYPSSDEGKVLSINDYGDLEWMTPDGGSSPLPTCDTTYPSDDEGKVLTVNGYGNLVWETPDGSLPEIPTSSTVFSSLVLTVNDDSIEWGQINDILCVGASDGVLTYHCGNVMWSSVFPSYDENDAGKVLTVNSQGELEWAMPS